MKKFFASLAIFALALAGCPTDDGNGNKSTTLRIKNESFIGITDVVWNNVSFTENQNSIRTGTNVTKNVQSGSGYIYFKREGNPIAVRTNTVIVADENTTNEFVFTNNALIAEVSNPGNTGTLQTFFSKPWINIKQSTDAVDLYGECDFGGVFPGEHKDITFTIENIGGANLVLENVNGNRVNLGENAEEYFSITQQPLAPTVAPESTTAFSIRFSPAATGNNFSASVLIKTNSQNAEEFAFRVKGNGKRTYGDTGPGGGIVFSVQGDRSLECSGDLGDFNWTAAMAAAQNYNGGGYSDWYLPNAGELDMMYLNLHLQGLGSFRNVWHWSSSYFLFGNVSPNAYMQDFGNGRKASDPIRQLHAVRAVRAFTN
jgi:hypothetical protein